MPFIIPVPENQCNIALVFASRRHQTVGFPAVRTEIYETPRRDENELTYERELAFFARCEYFWPSEARSPVHEIVQSHKLTPEFHGPRNGLCGFGGNLEPVRLAPEGYWCRRG